jgi:hypothetical protein
MSSMLTPDSCRIEKIKLSQRMSSRVGREPSDYKSNLVLTA